MQNLKLFKPGKKNFLPCHCNQQCKLRKCEIEIISIVIVAYIMIYKSKEVYFSVTLKVILKNKGIFLI